MAQMSRRRLIGSAVTLAAATAAQSLLPPSVHRAMAAPIPTGGLGAIEHVILLMQENRSFDHYFGTMRGVRGFGDTSPLRLRNGRNVFRQPGADSGDVLPFSVREAAARAGRPTTDIHYLDSLDHVWAGSTAAWAQGWWDGWIPAKTAATMTHYERRDIPLQYELADTFTLCDAYHCSLLGGTNPNRNYFFTGTTGFEPGSRRRAVDNAAYDEHHPGYDWTTYPERLEAAGVSWQIYQEWDNFTDNPVEYFAPFKRVGDAVLRGVDGGFATTEKFYESLAARPPGERRRLLDQLSSARDRLTPAQRGLFDRGMYRSEPGTLLHRLAADVRARRLPKVSWLVPPATFSEHPSASTPAGSADLIYRLLDVVASDLETWSKTAIFLTFDENDGYFDHIAPPVAPRPASGNDQDWYEGKAIGLGARVPMTVISPWTIGGYIDSEIFDHTSVLRFLELCTGVREPNISSWRRTVCGDMTSAFDFGNAGAPPRAHHPGPIPAPVGRWKPNPPDQQSIPRQEPGTRPTRPLPYQPAAGATLTGSTLSLRLRNSGTSSAHFTVYPFHSPDSAPRHIDVRDCATVEFEVGDGYDLVVQGPNRFWHELRAAMSGPASGVEVDTEPSDSGLTLVLANRGARTITVAIAPLDFDGAAQQVDMPANSSRTLPWPVRGGWYDLEITAPADPAFRQRATGRVENGRPGITPDHGRTRDRGAAAVAASARLLTGS